MPRSSPFLALVLLQAALPATAVAEPLKIRAVFPGTLAAPTAQWIELTRPFPGGGLVLAVQLEIYDRNDVLSDTVAITSRPIANSQDSLLFANPSAEALFGIGDDDDSPNRTFTLDPAGGRICVRDVTIDCFSWGSVSEPDGESYPALTPCLAVERDISRGTDPMALDPGDDTNNSARDFRDAEPTPRNLRGEVASIDRCGNGCVQIPEACDDANFVSGDGCSSCTVDPGFRCAGMPSVCTQTPCGNGILDPQETCDDANAIDGDGCDTSCRLEVGWTCRGMPSVCQLCGNGTVEGTEACDDGFTDACGSCNEDCSAAGTGAVCGDGLTCDEVEQCDDGNAIDTDACLGCVAATCGDGIVWSGVEACDGAGETETCNADCTGAVCGDGQINATAGETCDDGNTDGGDGCDVFCVVECGNGRLDGDEECDDGGESATCDRNCTMATCGDGTRNPTAGESCDLGSKNGPDAWCLDNCQRPVCGDGLVNGDDECDDGNLDDGDGCSAECVTEGCSCTSTTTQPSALLFGLVLLLLAYVRARSSRRKILPDADFGIESTNSTT